MTVLKTSRTIIRPWIESDAKPLFSVFSDPEAMRYWNAPPSANIDDVRAEIRRSLSAPPEIHAAWAVVIRETGQVIGFVNYHHRDMRNRRLEIGYILAREFWQRGFSTEAVSLLLDHCFQKLFVYRVEATVDPANTASISFLRRLGFELEGGPMRARMWTSDNRSLDALMFGLLAPEWRATPRYGPPLADV